MINSRDIIETVHDAAEKGIVAIPCFPGTKTPMVKWKQWQHEIPPVDLQREWFRRQCNVAILTTGMVVFDIDDAAKASLVLKECGDTPHKLRTPRGGLHLGYRLRAGTELANQVRIHGEPIDIRTTGGIEMIPPSVTADGRYEWLGAGLSAISELPVARIGWTRTRTRRRLQQVSIEPGTSAVLRARAYIAHIEGAIAGYRGHDRTMRVAGVLIQKFGLSIEQAWPLFLEWNEQCEPPWSERELRHKLEDALRLRGSPRSLE